jgi:CRP/FNR family cyclic AMP-dependent transcriptional regulator
VARPTLSEHPVFAGVAPEVLARLTDAAQPLAPGDDEELLSEGESELALFVLLAGSVKVLYRSPEGLELVVKLLAAPAVFGEMECIAGIPYLESVVAVERARLLRIPSAAFLAAVQESHALCANLLGDVAKRLCIAAQNERALAFHPVESRLAQLLLTYLDLYGLPAPDGRMIRVPLTQEGLAQALGVNRRSITRALAAWGAEGWLIKREGRYVVTDPVALERVTDPQLLRIGYRSGPRLR